MLTPKEVEYWGKKKEDENYAFRAFLKRSADPADLDKRFRNLHEQLFADYDCSKCRNCCSSYHSSFADEELYAAAKELEISKEEFCKQYLEYSDEEQKFESKNVPCDFLGENGQCVLGDCRPVDCKDYPYTKRNDRLGSLFTIIEMTKICPVVYEMMERLKEEYDFLNESQSVIKTEKKTYPNDPCPCGSGKKYKRCCGRNIGR